MILALVQKVHLQKGAFVEGIDQDKTAENRQSDPESIQYTCIYIIWSFAEGIDQDQTAQTVHSDSGVFYSFSGHIFVPIHTKLGHNFSLNEILDVFENGSCQIKI